ncbi:1258_t:CDS:2 [Rhizophagus irregularis]|nr:1258_t:CDS:2 [Rhizophagus irregularis]
MVLTVLLPSFFAFRPGFSSAFRPGLSSAFWPGLSLAFRPGLSPGID